MWIYIFLLSNYENLASETFKARYQSLYNGIKISSRAAISYKAVFAVRRFDIILDNLVLTQDAPLLNLERNHYLEKVIGFIFLQTSYLLYVKFVMPHDEKAFNVLELLNEYLLLVLGYTMLIFTGVGVVSYDTSDA